MGYFLRVNLIFQTHVHCASRQNAQKTVKNLHFISELLNQNDESTEFSFDDLIYETEKNVDNRMEREKQNFDIMDIMKINPQYDYNYPILGGLS